MGTFFVILAFAFLVTLFVEMTFGFDEPEGLAEAFGIEVSCEAAGEGAALPANAAGVSSTPAGEMTYQTPPAP